MTNIEQQFFKTFGIEARAKSKEVRSGLIECGLYYPEITAVKLLELICILNTITTPDLGDINVGRLRMSILEQCIEALKTVDWQNRIPTKTAYINEVRALFGGEE